MGFQSDRTDLSFVQHPHHKAVMGKVLSVLVADAGTRGAMLQGSVARGDAHPGADLDLVVLLQDGLPGGFRSEVVDGILVEYHSFDLASGRQKINSNPMLTYGFAEGRILYDPDALLSDLVELGRSVIRDYRTPAEEKRKLAYWLQSTRYKIASSLESRDILRASYILSTSSWQVLQSLWAVNDRPMPPAGAVTSQLRDLAATPDSLDKLFEALFAGDASARTDAGLAIIDWVLPLLEGDTNGPDREDSRITKSI